MPSALAWPTFSRFINRLSLPRSTSDDRENGICKETGHPVCRVLCQLQLTNILLLMLVSYPGFLPCFLLASESLIFSQENCSASKHKSLGWDQWNSWWNPWISPPPTQSLIVLQVQHFSSLATNSCIYQVDSVSLLMALSHLEALCVWGANTTLWITTKSSFVNIQIQSSDTWHLQTSL